MSSIKRKKYYRYNEEALMAACQSVIEGGKHIAVAAKEHGVPRSTLSARLRGRPAAPDARTVLTSEEEDSIIRWLIETSRRGFNQSRKQILSAVQTVLQDSKRNTSFQNNRPGRTWYKLFLKRHKDISIFLNSRSKVFTKEKIEEWFKTAQQDIASVDADVLNHPERIFNCHDSRFQQGGEITSIRKVETDCAAVTQEHVSVLTCGSASGEVLQPLLIFPRIRFHYDPMDGFQDALCAKSPSGDIDSVIFKRWLEDGFIPAVSDLPKPVLLFVDGHKSYLALPASELCREHDIILYHMPSHPDHLVPPLDLTTFEALKSYWREGVRCHERENSSLTTREFTKVFRVAWERAMQKDVVVSRFKAAGIYPWTLSADHINSMELGPSNTCTSMDCDSVRPPFLMPLTTTTNVSTGNAQKLSNAEAFDKMLLFASSLGTKKVTEFITFLDYNKQTKNHDPRFGQFCRSYSRISNIISNSNNCDRFYRLPWKRKQKGVTRHDEYRKLVEEKKKKMEEEEKEKKEQKNEKGKEDERTDFHMADDSDAEICFGCMGEKDGEMNEWVGCDCGRWYHVGCVCDERLVGKNLTDIMEMIFTCSVCLNEKK